MAKVRYTVRFYRLHDLDLITFIMTHEFDVMRAIYSSITAFAKGEYFIIQIPSAVHTELPPLRYAYTKALTLDTEKDQATIELINKIQPGKRNNFFKSLLRLYLVHPFSETFFTDPADMALFEEKLSAMRSGQREVRAGKVKRVVSRKQKPGKETSVLTTNEETKDAKFFQKGVEEWRKSNEADPTSEDAALIGNPSATDDVPEADESADALFAFVSNLSR